MEEFNPEELLKDINDIEIIKKLPDHYIHEKTILGIDIYKYSQYQTYEQIYIPVVFEKLYQLTVNNLIEHEEFLFCDYCNNLQDYKKKFISTGDGGFQIFDNVIQAIIFALFFQANVKRYCSGGSVDSLAKKLYQIVDTIELRYAITTDSIYSYKSTFYGPAIINNDRILSKDSLNRLLIDSNSVNWLTRNINGPENLIDLDKTSFLKTKYFSDYEQELFSYIFNVKGIIKTVDILKIGTIKSKSTELDIYNLHVQALLNFMVEHHDYRIYLVTLGNLNTSGIE